MVGRECCEPNFVQMIKGTNNPAGTLTSKEAQTLYQRSDRTYTNTYTNVPDIHINTCLINFTLYYDRTRHFLKASLSSEGKV
jgi:hypothetical protein